MDKKKKQKLSPKECFNCGKDLTEDDCYFRYLPADKVSVCLQCASVIYPVSEEGNAPDPDAISYVAVNKKSSRVFTKDWDSNEEAELLGYLMTMGHGNWNAIAERIPNHTPRDIQTHYEEIYLKSKTAPYACFPESEDDMPEKYAPPPPPDFETVQQSSNPYSDDVNQWMPKRHEFEKEFENDAEIILNNLTIDNNETRESFDTKMQRLKVYNKLLLEREIRNKVLEDWELIYNDTPKFGANSQKHDDEFIFKFAPYFDKKYLESHIILMHKIDELNSHIESCKKYQAEGARNVNEGKLIDMLEKCISQNRIVDTEQWNRFVSQIERNQEVPAPSDFNSEEQQLIHSLGIDAPRYMALKDLLIREYAVSQKLSLSDAIALSPDDKEDIVQIYAFFQEQGWL